MGAQIESIKFASDLLIEVDGGVKTAIFPWVFGEERGEVGVDHGGSCAAKLGQELPVEVVLLDHLLIVLNSK